MPANVIGDNSGWPDSAQFWRWSLALYPTVKPIALKWQDEFGVNVNLLLLLLYLQRRQLPLPAAEILLLQQAVQAQQQLFTAPLRQLRRQLPAHSSESAVTNFKQQLLEAELCSEQLEQQQLIQCLKSLPLRPTLPGSSLLTLYLQQLAVDPTPLYLQIVDLDQAATTVKFSPV